MSVYGTYGASRFGVTRRVTMLAGTNAIYSVTILSIVEKPPQLFIVRPSGSAIGVLPGSDVSGPTDFWAQPVNGGALSSGGGTTPSTIAANAWTFIPDGAIWPWEVSHVVEPIVGTNADEQAFCFLLVDSAGEPLSSALSTNVIVDIWCASSVKDWKVAIFEP